MLSPKLSGVRLIGSAAVLLSASFVPFAASAQSQSDNTSVADAARRAREQKKAAAKPVRTLTNDDLPAAPADAVRPAAAPTPATEATASGEQGKSETATTSRPVGSEPTAEADAAGKRAETEAALKRVKAELAQAQGELDVLQRKAALDSDSYYSKTDYARDSEAKARLDADAQQINDKKAQVDNLKAKIAALQAELGEAAEADKPAQPL
jgi:hypothetical protein